MTKSYKFVFNHPYAVINWLQSEEKNKNQGRQSQATSK